MNRTAQYDVLKIRISGLSNGVHSYHLSSDPVSVGLENNFRPPVIVDVMLEKAARQILLKAAVDVSANFDCDRCVERFEQHIQSSYTMVYLFEEPDSKKFSEGDVTVINPGTVFIDITEDVRQIILLSIPMKLLCSEHCKGLCPRCGTNWNTASCDCHAEARDPRWQSAAGGLEGLLNK